jgi:thiol-disulfide isomerase/thioredoxin
MKIRRFLICLTTILGLFLSCKNEKKQDVIQDSEDITVYDFNGLEPLLYTKSDKTYLINFWAMWCAPCVEEMPYIQEYARNNPDVEVIFVSMDFPKDIETKLKPFLEEKNISSKVVLLDDPDANTWINKINPDWSGSIPYTIMFNNKKRFYYERPFVDLLDLENEINKNFNL